MLLGMLFGTLQKNMFFRISCFFGVSQKAWQSKGEFKMEFFDSHSHLNDEKFDNDRFEIIEKMKKY